MMCFRAVRMLKTIQVVFVVNMSKVSMNKKAQRGFTIVELAIVVVISSLFLFSIFKALALYSEEVAKDTTELNIDVLDASMSRFFQANDRYPCPARLDAVPGDADYGLEQCADPNNLDVAGHVDNPVFNGDPAGTPGNVYDSILIGAFPVHTIEPCLLNDLPECARRDLFLTEERMFDGYGNKLTYAVTQGLTDETAYRNTGGGIEVEDENLLSVLETPYTAHYIIFSHGPNGRGAYNREGNLVQDNCAPGAPVPGPPPPPPTEQDERENCDHDDGLFVSGLFNDNEDSNSFFDDTIEFRLVELASLWNRTGQSEIVNANEGGVGIGNFNPGETPTDDLHIKGDLQATDLFADALCDDSGAVSAANCFRPDFFGGPPKTAPDGTDPIDFINSCDPSEAIVKIANNRVTCAPVFTGGVISGRCAQDDPSTPTVNEYEIMVGYSSTTGVVCDLLYPP